ncbi:MAG: LemA family protein [Patescibacteria group bacterium]
MKRSTILILAIVVILTAGGVSVYNRLVTASQAIDSQWAQVETQYQRRFDLIPNLVESVKGIFEQEQEVFGKLADARSRYAGATTVDQKAQAAGEVESALARLLVVVENYPQLRSAENVTALMDELAGTENRVAVERGRFNEKVRDYNTMILRFPTNLFARVFGFNARTYFEATTGAETAPQVNFTE